MPNPEQNELFHVDPIEEPEGDFCEIHGCPKEYEQCGDCIDGRVGMHECDPLWYTGRYRFITCGTCDGKGGWTYCPQCAEERQKSA